MPTNIKKQHQVIALAGLFQCCQLVDELAHKGTAPVDQMEALINSLFIQNPENTLEVYGSLDNLKPGMALLEELLKMSHTQKNSHILRYGISVLQIAQNLRRNKPMLEQISNRISEINRQRLHFSTMHANVISSLADLYLQTLSTFRHRIQVSGSAHNLQQPLVAEKIRCLLFAGVRSAILWHQLGGRRWHLLVNRKAMLECLAATSKTPEAP